jgi:phospholipase D-like protein
MAKLVSARAYANNAVVMIAWRVDGKIAGCLGFNVERVIAATGATTPLPAWVPFKGGSNSGWQPRDTSVWPVQKFTWRDLTLAEELKKAELDPETEIKYRVTTMGAAAGAAPANGVVPLAPIGAPVETNPVKRTTIYGDVGAAFNNGILSTQWLTRALQAAHPGMPPLTALKQEIANKSSTIRARLAGDTLPFLRFLLERAAAEKGSVHLALYELDDQELFDLLVANKSRIHLILSNTSLDRAKGVWDTENAPFRQKLHQPGVDIQDRLFNNNGHIGHNKFAVYRDAQGNPTEILSGSTNWTPNGLCAQSNNAVLVNSPDVAKAYLDYWNRLHADALPAPPSVGATMNANVQGQPLRSANMKPAAATLDSGGTAVQMWFSPNTKAATKNANSPAPPDLAEVFKRMSAAKQAIFFLVFLPSAGGLQSVIDEAIKMGEANPNLLVLGAISSPLAMPRLGATEAETEAAAAARDPDAGGTVIFNSKRRSARPSAAAVRGHGPGLAAGQPAAPAQPAGKGTYVYRSNTTEIVLAKQLNDQDIVGAFEHELLSAGNAIIHDKIVVIDPLSPDCTVITGSHNLGYKASYANDENLLIIKGNQLLAHAFAVHVMDVYEHYRFRAVQAAAKDAGREAFSGFLETSDAWQDAYMKGDQGGEARYFSGG